MTRVAHTQGVSDGAPDGLCDALGRVHAAHPDARIVCLVPSLTELLCDLGLAGRLVGRTGFCIHPSSVVRHIPKVGGTKDVNIAKIRRIAPTHLIVNIDENEKPTVDALAQFIPNVVVTHPQTPRDNLTLFRLFGRLFGAEAAAERLCVLFERAYAQITACPMPSRAVLYLIWKDPWMTVAPDTYIGNMLALTGWRQVALAKSERYPRVELEETVSEVELVLLSSEPYRFSANDRTTLAARLPEQRVLLVDGEMLSWYGSRSILGLDYLLRLAQAEVLHST